MNLSDIRRYGPAALLALLIPALSLLPAAFFRNVPREARFPGTDKAVHALMYAALTLALFRALEPHARADIRSAGVVACSASLYGLSLEIMQGVFTTSRSMDLYDALANAAGAFITALLVHLWFRKWKTAEPASQLPPPNS
jgi:VanZ family protein